MSKEHFFKPLPKSKSESALAGTDCLAIDNVKLIILLYFISAMKKEPIRILDSFR